MNSKQNLGQFGENNAIEYLKKNRYKIIARNYRCKFGEIDIIAKKKKVLVFIEVKTRQNMQFGCPIEAVTKIKQKHIYNTATYYLLNNKIKYDNIRIDGIEVYISTRTIQINHIKNIITN